MTAAGSPEGGARQHMISSRATIRVLATGWSALHLPRVPFAPIVLEHLIIETTRLKLVEVPHSDPKHSLTELLNGCFVHFMLLNKLQDEFCCSNACRDGRDSDPPPRPRLALPNKPQIVPERSRPVFVPRPYAPRRPNNLSPCDGFLPKWCR